MPTETKTGLETGSHAFALVFHDSYVSIHYAEIMGKATNISGELVYLMRISPPDGAPTIIPVNSRFVSGSLSLIIEASTQKLNKDEATLQDELCLLRKDLMKVQPDIGVATQKVSEVQEILTKLKRIGELRKSIEKTSHEALLGRYSV